jgi:hypothetical protein
MHKPSIQSIHNEHYQFNSEQPAALILQYSKILKCWKLASYSCRHCGNSFKGLITCHKHFSLCKELNSIKRRKTFVPIQVVTIKGERYYKWGDSGKPYKNRADAEKQAQAAYASGYKEPKTNMKEKK